MIHDLFGDMGESLSPRVKWMRDNRVKVILTEGQEMKMFGPYKAVSGTHEAFGVTEDESIVRLANKLWSKENIKLWSMK